MIIAVAFLAAEAPLNTSTDPVQKYMSCVVWKAGDLESSGEAANLIADAVAPTCDGLLTAAANTLTEEFLSKPDMVEYQKRYAVNRGELDATNAEQLRKSAIKEAQLLVIELRAKRSRAANAKN